MFKKTEKNVSAQTEGRVLGQLLSREETLRVSGGGDNQAMATDSWVDCGVCTPKSDPQQN